MKNERGQKVLPEDQYNQALVSNVSPPGWKNPEPSGRYNLVVIGGGTAGLVTAAGAAGLGAKVALIERHLLGGDCLNYGCVPSKSIIRSSRSAADVRLSASYGIQAPGGAEVDFPKVMERMRRLRSKISSHDSAERFQSLGVDVFLGEARFTGKDTVEVDGETLRFSKAVIATGARAVALPIEGLKESGYLTNETVFSLTDRPERLAVIGGGPIGSELSQAFQRLGSRVTVFEVGDHLLGREDSDAAEILQSVFLREGIQLILKASLKKVFRSAEGKVILYEKDGREERLVVDEILVGVGRAPNVEGLNLDAVGVEYDQKSGVKVDDTLRTTNHRIFAAGDVCLQYKFTHTADAAARIVIQNALFLGSKKFSGLTIPWVTYTDPEIAHVGMYERDAMEKGIAVDTFIRPLSEVDRAVVEGEEDGFVKVHVKKGTDKILGATIVARHAGEMISEISVAMVNGLGLKALGNTIHPYPTQAEAIRQVADLYNRTRLTPLIRKVFSRWLGFGRMELAVVLSGFRHAFRNFLPRALGSLRLKKLPQAGKD
jgi:pyruvate/2-oxoglutarate dehydrogenase complex dihydrolipoamide dehydrogenase (E3) component